jgi:hypothetical protein
LKNFEFTPNEIQELKDLKANGYKIIKQGQQIDGSISPECVFCQNQENTISLYAADDNKKEVIIFSLCPDCLKKLVAASLVFKVSAQQILDRKIDTILSDIQKRNGN